MLLAKLETVYTGSGDPSSSVVSFLIFFQIPSLINVGIEKILDLSLHYFPCCFAVCFQHGSGTSCVVRLASFQQSQCAC